MAPSTSWRSFWRSALPPFALTWGIAALAVLAVALARPHRVAGYVPDHKDFLVCALLIAMIAQVVVTGFARLLSAPSQQGG
jgi:hypothetical protein